MKTFNFISKARKLLTQTIKCIARLKTNQIANRGIFM